jgi:hypothetical protein
MIDGTLSSSTLEQTYTWNAHGERTSKPVISHVQRVQVRAGIQIQMGIVGPQVEGAIYFPGGGTQVQILNFADRARLIQVGPPRPIK